MHSVLHVPSQSPSHPIAILHFLHESSHNWSSTIQYFSSNILPQTPSFGMTIGCLLIDLFPYCYCINGQKHIQSLIMLHYFQCIDLPLQHFLQNFAFKKPTRFTKSKEWRQPTTYINFNLRGCWM